MPKFVVAADLHLRNRTWSRLPLYGDSYVALAELAGVATGHTGLILAGDLFTTADHPDMPMSLLRLIEATRPVKNIIYTVGNHDKTGAPSGAENPEWVESVVDHKIQFNSPDGPVELGPNWKYQEDLVHEVEGIKFVVMHHTSDRELLRNKLMRLGMTKFDVLVMHQGLVETISRDDAYETTTEEIAGFLADTGVKCVIVGHIHTPMQWRSANGILFVSPGATYRESLDPKESEGRYGILTIDDGFVEYESVMVTNQRQREFMDPLPADPAKLQEYIDYITGMAVNARFSKLPEEIRKPLVVFDYVVMPGVVSGVMEAAGDQVCVDITPIHTTVYRHLVREHDEEAQPAAQEEYIDFAAAARKYASGRALEVIMAVYRGENPEVAVNQALAAITG